MTSKYDTIGKSYSDLRRPDPRIAAQIHTHLGDARTVVNVGAGTGSYEPAGKLVTAVEPSAEMIGKRASGAHAVVQANAEKLPFEDDSFDAAMAVLTVHHWTDQKAGISEMRRVSRGPVVILTFDPEARPWLTDYLPSLAALDQEQMPPMQRYAEWLGEVAVETVPIPHDCLDGFLYAYWRRPEAYLDPHIRSGSSSFWALPDVEDGLERLKSDLESGVWAERYADLLKLDDYDAGYRLIVTREA